mgnify:CR=1 FL=1
MTMIKRKMIRIQSRLWTNSNKLLTIRTEQSTLGNWTPELNNAEFKARAYELKAELETNDNTAQLAVQNLQVTSNMPRRTINGTATTSATSNYTITFTNKFAATPVIGITFSATNSGDYYNISNSNANSFSVSIYNQSNVRQAKAFSWTATGYGKG